MIQLKHNVRVTGLRPEIVLAIMVADGIYAEHGVPLVLTSLNDSTHAGGKSGSLHYVGCAADLRIKHLSGREAAQDLAEQIQAALGVDYDVVLESDHIHIEFDPKSGL